MLRQVVSHVVFTSLAREEVLGNSLQKHHEPLVLVCSVNRPDYKDDRQLKFIQQRRRREMGDAARRSGLDTCQAATSDLVSPNGH